jgi:hypothetical protein
MSDILNFDFLAAARFSAGLPSALQWKLLSIPDVALQQFFLSNHMVFFLRK